MPRGSSGDLPFDGMVFGFRWGAGDQAPARAEMVNAAVAAGARIAFEPLESRQGATHLVVTGTASQPSEEDMTALKRLRIDIVGPEFILGGAAGAGGTGADQAWTFPHSNENVPPSFGGGQAPAAHVAAVKRIMKKMAADRKRKFVVEVAEVEEAEEEEFDGVDLSAAVSGFAKGKSYKPGDPNAPLFPDDYELEVHEVLQMTNLAGNNNKYYSLELHRGTFGTGLATYRVYTHWGRTDDLLHNPEAGQRQVKYFGEDKEAAVAHFNKTHDSKTRKGYAKVILTSGKIGSRKAREAATKATADDAATARGGSDGGGGTASLPAEVLALVQTLYAEASSALTSIVNVTITAHGIETPLGVLGEDQVGRGEAVLDEIEALIADAQQDPAAGLHDRNSSARLAQVRGRGAGRVLFGSGSDGSGGDDDDDLRADLQSLSSEFYSVIPHRLTAKRNQQGRAEMAALIISDLDTVREKRDLLQLMRDMISVVEAGAGGGDAAGDAALVNKYHALACDLEPIAPGDADDASLRSLIASTTDPSRPIRVKSIFRVSRRSEVDAAQLNKAYGPPVRRLYHGSRASNWVGLLSRGILMPRQVVSKGGRRTDAGMLGAGIYFGDSADATAKYCHPVNGDNGSPFGDGTRFMALASVALGQSKRTTVMMPDLEAPPVGYNSVHGVRSTPFSHSDFADDEFVVYEAGRQVLSYLVAFEADTPAARAIADGESGFVSANHPHHNGENAVVSKAATTASATVALTSPGGGIEKTISRMSWAQPSLDDLHKGEPWRLPTGKLAPSGGRTSDFHQPPRKSIVAAPPIRPDLFSPPRAGTGPAPPLFPHTSPSSSASSDEDAARLASQQYVPRIPTPKDKTSSASMRAARMALPQPQQHQSDRQRLPAEQPSLQQQVTSAAFVPHAKHPGYVSGTFIPPRKPILPLANGHKDGHKAAARPAAITAGSSSPGSSYDVDLGPVPTALPTAAAVGKHKVDASAGSVLPSLSNLGPLPTVAREPAKGISKASTARKRMGRLLTLIGVLYRNHLIDRETRGAIKDLVVCDHSGAVGALEAFERTSDMDDFLDSIHRIVRSAKPPVPQAVLR